MRVVGCFDDTEEDVLQDRRTKRTIKLNDEGQPDKTILVLQTKKISKLPMTNSLKRLVKDIQTGNKTAIVTKLSDADLSRAYVPVVSSEQAATLESCFQEKIDKGHGIQCCEVLTRRKV